MTHVLTWISTVARAAQASAGTVLVETEGFKDPGGWVVDPQFMDQMGSPYLLAHGLGRPVKDATTTAEFPSSGTYRVLARTKDWVAQWQAPGAPGRFQLLVDGNALETTFGSVAANWHWQSGGSVRIGAELKPAFALHDLTGFEGRCDASLFTTDESLVPPNDGEEMVRFRRRLLGCPEEPALAGDFDLANHQRVIATLPSMPCKCCRRDSAAGKLATLQPAIPCSPERTWTTIFGSFTTNAQTL